MRDKIKLAERIDDFIIKYTGIRPDYDVERERKNTIL